VRDAWLGPELDAGLDPARLQAAFDHVRSFLHVAPIGPAARRNPGAELLAEAIKSMGARHNGGLRVVECNIAGCLGAGYCNIGCSFGKKLSALDWTLPLTQYVHGDRLQIVPECRVEKLIMRGGRATGVRARLGDGRRLRVQAGTVVLSAGALASSVVLQRSGLGSGRAGQRLSFNIASPVTLDFERDLHSERGAQISHYLDPDAPSSRASRSRAGSTRS
jgi:choline dehydrogenase-like flavoprotein